MTLPNKSIKIFLNRVLGPLLFIWFSYSIYRQIEHQPNLSECVGYIKEALIGTIAWKFWLVMILMFLNWAIETVKWQMLMKPLQQISLWHAFKAVITGLAFALHSPNRVGEYGGRMLYIEKGKRFKSVSITVIGSLSQLMVTLLLGGIGLFLQKDDLIQSSAGNGAMHTGIRVLEWCVIVFAIVLMVFYFRLGWLVRCLKMLKLRDKWVQQLEVLNEVGVTILLRVIGLSALRYLVFVYQYILLLQVMHVHIDVADAFWLISILYLILALVPTIALLEIGLRGKVAILLFQLYSENILGIYAASTGIWLINLVLPALAGSLLVASFKFFNIRQ